MTRLFCTVLVASCVALAVPATEQVVLSSYLGGPGDDSLTGAALLSDGSIVLVGTMPGGELAAGDRVPAQEGRGDTILLRLATDGEKMLSVMRFDSSLDDLDVDAQNNVYVAGAFGSAKLDGHAPGDRRNL